MEFAFTDEQLMIRDTADAFLAEVSTSAAVRAAAESELGYDAELWQRICSEMYWQAIHLPEDCGGMGLGFVELAAVLEQMGRRLLCSPFFSTVCLGANALLVAGDEAQRQRWLAPIAAGELTATLAYKDASRDWSASAIGGSWKEQGEDYCLNGEYRYVPDGHSAGLIVVAASSEQGVSLFAVPADTPGLRAERLATMDQTRSLSTVTLEDVIVSADTRLGSGDSSSDLQTILDLATVCLAAEQVGVTQEALDSTVAYTSERVQFNRTIASYQAVKHKAADMMLKAEAARSAAYYAACIAEETLQGGSLAGELAEAASIAKSYCSDAAYFCTGTGIQLHGGVGFTWEYDIQMLFKRARASESLLGEPSYHRERIAALLLDGSPVEVMA